MSKTPRPEHEKLHAIKDKSQAIGEFVEWLGSEGIVLARYHAHDENCLNEHGRLGCGMSRERLYPEHLAIRKMLAHYFGIDEDRLEAEKRAMLDEIRRTA